MENKFRNEMEIVLGEHKILLRPTFENIAAMEANVGSVAYLGWKYSRGIRVDKDGKADKGSLNSADAVKALPPMSEAAQIIFYNQAATKADDPTLKKYSLEEIWDMVLQRGSPVVRDVFVFLGRITAGSKSFDPKAETTPEEKKD